MRVIFALSSWLGRLTELDLVVTKGKTKATEYLVNPDFLKKANFKGKTNLERIENHRLEELIYQDVNIYGPTGKSDIQTRIGSEIPIRKIKSTLDKIVKNKILCKNGTYRWTLYSINQNG